VLDERQESENATLSARHALLNLIEILTKAGYTREQAYIIASVAVDLRLSQLVDVPNFTVSAFLPLDIFIEPPRELLDLAL
jgi:formamidase